MFKQVYRGGLAVVQQIRRYRRRDVSAYYPYSGQGPRAFPRLRVMPARPQPACSKCGTPMTIHVLKHGPHAGEPFYACPNFPECETAELLV